MITLGNLQKTFGNQHVLRGVNYTFEANSKTVILGSNGSGKSTLIKILSGAQEATENAPQYNFNGKSIPSVEAGSICTVAAPYVALNPMFSLKETLNFHARMCGFTQGINLDQWIEDAGLKPHFNKRLKTYSSGMKQRVRLLLAIASPRPVLLLDEPTSNLDKQGVELYRRMIQELAIDKTIIVASNYVAQEYDFCSGKLLLEKHY
ncbi:MAG TPA: ABC transporter ATP-binding protein [Cryomorphaceae bacterium]|nr:ABC transporter ATP-binding protein [Cryomorphaceae bacterium]|tara:strand:- start:2147 stop:2764 length:618 start_codon:yes stop_codon:yes gene_type:complete